MYKRTSESRCSMTGKKLPHLVFFMLSVRRYRILAEVFLRQGLIEAFGTGIMRIRDTYKDSIK